MGRFLRSVQRGIQRPWRSLGKQANIDRYVCPKCKRVPQRLLWSAPDKFGRKTMVCGDCAMQGIAVPVRCRNLFTPYKEDPNVTLKPGPNAAGGQDRTTDPSVPGSTQDPAEGVGKSVGAAPVEPVPDRDGNG